MGAIADAFDPLFDVELQRNPRPSDLFGATWEGLPEQPDRPVAKG
jgi:hypothetical protein